MRGRGGRIPGARAQVQQRQAVHLFKWHLIQSGQSRDLLHYAAKLIFMAPELEHEHLVWAAFLSCCSMMLWSINFDMGVSALAATIGNVILID